MQIPTPICQRDENKHFNSIENLRLPFNRPSNGSFTGIRVSVAKSQSRKAAKQSTIYDLRRNHYHSLFPIGDQISAHNPPKTCFTHAIMNAIPLK